MRMPWGTLALCMSCAKNHLFFGSAEAGGNNALPDTLIGNRRRQGLDPESYLVEAIRRLPAGATPEQAAAVTPARIAAARAKTAEAEAQVAAAAALTA